MSKQWLWLLLGMALLPGAVGAQPSVPMPDVRLVDAQENAIRTDAGLFWHPGDLIRVRFSWPGQPSERADPRAQVLWVTLAGPRSVTPAYGFLWPALAGADRNPGPEDTAVIVTLRVPAVPDGEAVGTPLLSETPVPARATTPHWELRAGQLGVDWLRPDGRVAVWEPDPQAPAWDPARNTAPWVTINPVGAAGAWAGVWSGSFSVGGGAVDLLAVAVDTAGHTAGVWQRVGAGFGGGVSGTVGPGGVLRLVFTGSQPADPRQGAAGGSHLAANGHWRGTVMVDSGPDGGDFFTFDLERSPPAGG